MICLIDYDSTCVYSVAGGYSTKDTGAAKVLRRMVKSGFQLVLWTCRNNSPDNPYNLLPNGQPRKETSLDEAVRWFREKRIPLVGVNTWEGSKEYIGQSNKPLAEFCIDDINLGTPIRWDEVEFTRYEDDTVFKAYAKIVDWKAVEKLLETQGLLV